ncbi:hypothetical protein [Halarcobacter anaerophilus]|jgi:hypothetical protein|uniref:Uncharacterized protein n=1 Tax=Halarcobacter anaerophilus TaxID=877500 RepID=A0A4Q0Y3V5_9BACT|nr:hypothetical protein [Halarcobacter anaerophilus]QDF27527.1 hypothetical protein AANAER_0013 [Halarcobacter anaerophilus]RXJ63884.1 hypothetical protein CRV06_02770 [Halarcobacter anaerophilus]
MSAADSLIEQLNRAFESDNIDELRSLHESPDMNIRRAVAKNSNIDSDIANDLLYDPVLNVSYMASLNPKCTISRNFCNVKLTKCVVCKKDERNLDCLECNK